MIRTMAVRLLAGTVSLALVSTPVLARKAAQESDLIGVNAASGQSALESRGYSYAADAQSAAGRAGFYWHAGDKDCIRVETINGRYASITDASHGDCGQKSSGSGGAIAAGVIGAAVIGALLLSKKSKNNTQGGYQQDWQQVRVEGLQNGLMRIFANPSRNARVRDDVGEGTILRNYGCDYYESETWCQVETLDRRTQGWARDRFLRPMDGVGAYPPGGGWGAASEPVIVSGVNGQMRINSGPSRNDYAVGRVGNGTRLLRMGCQMSQGEQWCQVTTTDRQMYGWARERFLRPTSGGGYYPPGGGNYPPGGGYYPPGGGGNWGQADYRDLIGARAAAAMDQLDRRGFRQVDNFVSGNTRYSIRWRAQSRQCLQTVIADGRVTDIADIGQHPRCR